MSLIFNLGAILGAGLTAFLYWLGLVEFYFWYYPWFDVPLHVAAGFTVGAWGAALAARRRYSPGQALLFLILLALAVGLTWELFEYVSGLTRGEPGYWFDTLKDIGDDMLGAALAAGLYWFAYRK